MARKEILDRIEKYIDPFRITKGKSFRLDDFDPGDTCGLRLDKAEAAATRHRVARRGAGHALRPESLVAVACVPGDGCGRQGRDHQARHVRCKSSGLSSFLVQAALVGGSRSRFSLALREALARAGKHRIFNRSYYEEVLVVRVHEHIWNRQKLPPSLLSKRIWDERLFDIAHFEDYLTRQGTIILKFFLHVSRKEQKKRFMERLDRPDKHWKFSPSDVHERRFWGDYKHAFEEAIRATASKRAPWYVVPADNKWFTRLLVAAAIVEAVEKLDLAYPTVDSKKKKELQTMRAALSREK